MAVGEVHGRRDRLDGHCGRHVGVPFAGCGSDEGYYLRATVTYTDMFAEGQTASAVTENAVEERTTSNAAPSFEDHDTDTTTADVVEVARELEEGTAAKTNIGDPVAAADADNDILLYSIVEDVGWAVLPRLTTKSSTSIHGTVS